MKLSIITVTFNAAGTFDALSDSLRAQDDRDFEWIVVDGASTDDTVDRVRQCDVVTRWLSEPDFGVYDALNKGLKLASGDYYLVVGADDTLDPGAIGRYRQAAVASGADIISAPVRVDGELAVPRKSLPMLRSGPPLVSAHSVGSLIRTRLHAELGFYSRKLPIAADTLFLLGAWQAGKRFAYLDEPAGTFGTGGVSSTDVLGALTESMRANIAVRGQWPLHVLLLVLRVIRNAGRIQRAMARRGPR